MTGPSENPDSHPDSHPNPYPDLSQDFTGWTPKECSDAVLELRRTRTAYGIPPVRFVSRINKLGFTVTPPVYTKAESYPAYAAPLVQRGILPYAYAALSEPPEVNQDPWTYYAMNTLREAREALEMSHRDIVEYIESVAPLVSPTEAEYRSCERGTTKKVPWVWVLHAADCLDIPLTDLKTPDGDTTS